MGMPSKKKYSRQYSLEYLSYGFIQAPNDNQIPMCLICKQTFSNEAMKPSRLRAHLNAMHSDKKDKSLEYFKTLYEQFKKRQTITTMFQKGNAKVVDGLVASYQISQLIAKCSKPHNIAETLILPAVREIISTVMHQDPTEVIKVLPLSDTSVQRRIDEMALDVEEQLVTILRVTQFSLQMDESTLPGNEALLMGYVRYFDKDHKLQEEMLFAEKLHIDTKGISIFATLKTFLDTKHIPFNNIVACATDGAPAMVGRYRGFLAHLKTAVPGIFTVHCVAHRQHLVAKLLGEDLHSSLGTVIRAVNKIKCNSLNDRIFRQLCENNDEQHNRLILHTAVRWLSQGNSLARFAELFDSILQFFETNNDITFCEELKAAKKDAFYLAGIFQKFNEINLKLQGQCVTLIDSKKVILTFIQRLALYRQNILRREFYQFPMLDSVSEEVNIDDINKFSNHLNLLEADMSTRFCDLIQLQVPAWMIDPLKANVLDAEVQIQEELIELQNDDIAHALYNKGGYIQIWQRKEMSTLYPHLWQKMRLLILPFPTSYLVECGFSAATNLLTKQRYNLDIAKRGDLRLHLTHLKPDIKSLASKHQAQGSH